MAVSLAGGHDADSFPLLAGTDGAALCVIDAVDAVDVGGGAEVGEDEVGEDEEFENGAAECAGKAIGG